MSESDESGGEEKSAPDSGSDWSQAGKAAAAGSDGGGDDDDDDVSMADESDDSPVVGKGSASGKKHRKSTPGMVRFLSCRCISCTLAQCVLASLLAKPYPLCVCTLCVTDTPQQALEGSYATMTCFGCRLTPAQL